MKTIANLAITAFVAFSILSCQQKSEKITNSKDYNHFLTISKNQAFEATQNEINFWQKKFDKAPNQISYLGILASNYLKLFQITGNFDNLKKAESLLIKSNETFKYSSVISIRALSQNYLVQHKLTKALELANKAKTIGENIKETEKLLFDVQMELGNYNESKKNLNFLRDENDFDYLIRVAKWNTHLGDLKTTIAIMEKAKAKIETGNDKHLIIWTYSNLAYLNAHAGNIKQSYDYYLKTLALDPNNSYALQGIAWIVFFHDRDTKEAKRIVAVVSKRNDSTNLHLLTTKISEYENMDKSKHENINHYNSMLDNSNYSGTTFTMSSYLPERN